MLVKDDIEDYYLKAVKMVNPEELTDADFLTILRLEIYTGLPFFVTDAIFNCLLECMKIANRNLKNKSESQSSYRILVGYGQEGRIKTIHYVFEKDRGFTTIEREVYLTFIEYYVNNVSRSYYEYGLWDSLLPNAIDTYYEGKSEAIHTVLTGYLRSTDRERIIVMHRKHFLNLIGKLTNEKRFSRSLLNRTNRIDDKLGLCYTDWSNVTKEGKLTKKTEV